MLNNFSTRHVLSHPLFLVTFALAFPAWIIAFASQIAAEAQYNGATTSTVDLPDSLDGGGTTTGSGTGTGGGGVFGGSSLSGRSFTSNSFATLSLGSGGRHEPVVKSLWYAIWIQLAVTIHLFLAVCTDQLPIHRLQIAIFAAIAEVFAVLGVEYIYSTAGSLIAVGVGWLLIAMIDLVWILYLTSEDGTPFHSLLSFGGRGPAFGNRRNLRQTNKAAAYEGDGPGISSAGQYNGMNGGGYSSVGGHNATYSSGAPDSGVPKMGATNDFAATAPSGPSGPTSGEPGVQRAKAMYAYNANPDDPNEVSFAKGDLLEVMDNTGKWFQVRTPSGHAGIAPSNYLTML